MKNSNSHDTQKSSTKRDPGFVKIRRGFLDHLPDISANATKLYIWLHLTAFWEGQKRGLVEASFYDMARGNGWSLKKLQRAIDELEARPYITVERASNQHKLTRIKILKYDLDEAYSAVDKSDHSKCSAVDTAVDSAVDSAVVKSVHSNPAKPQDQQGLQAPKKYRSIEEKKDGLDAVRRPKDAELHSADKKVFSPSERKKRLAVRLREAVRRNGNEFCGELNKVERAAFEYIKYSPCALHSLSDGFVFSVWLLYKDHKDKLPLPGILCSKIIDKCLSEQESNKKQGIEPSDYFWPVDFQEHRNRLRAEERKREQIAHLGDGLRA